MQESTEDGLCTGFYAPALINLHVHYLEDLLHLAEVFHTVNQLHFSPIPCAASHRVHSITDQDDGRKR